MISTSNLFVLIAIGVAWYNMSSGPTTGKIVETQHGLAEGTTSVSRDGREFYEWLGIPFAQPPMNHLRFQSPQPIEPWDGILEAKDYRPECASVKFVTTETFGEEDCLYLNVHVPKITKIVGGSSQLLPVIIYISGEAFMEGSTREMRPDYFMDEDVVFVTFNYRLGVLGFLSTGDDIIKGNMGLKDQVMAIQWVNNNIKAFGGDPNRITLMGHSAGAASVHYHLLSWQTKGMFQKAVMISGAAGAPWSFVPPDRAAKKTESVAKILKCPTQDTVAIAECLKGLDVSSLLGAIMKDMRENFLYKPHLKGEIVGPTIEAFDDEDAYLTQHPFQILEKGKFQKVPLLAGVMAAEGLASSYSFWETGPKVAFEATSTESIRRVCLPSNETEMDDMIAERIKDYYMFNRKTKIQSNEGEEPLHYVHLFSDCFYNKPVSRAVEYQRLHANSYPFYFNVKGGPSKTELMMSLGSGFWHLEYYMRLTLFYLKSLIAETASESAFGVNHGDDLPFLFPMDLMSKISQGHSLYSFSKRWVKFLAEFASSKNENLRFGKIDIPPQLKAGPVTYLEVSHQPKLVAAPFQQRLDFLKSIGMR